MTVVTNNIKLFVFDLDGTALGGHTPYHRFSEGFVNLLHDLDNMGVKWATNTTWGLEMQESLILNSCVKSEPAFLCGGTGSTLGKIERGRLLQDKEYNQAVIERDKAFRAEHWQQVREVCQSLLGHDAVEELAYDSQNILSFRVRPDHLERVENILFPLLEGGRFYRFDPQNIVSVSLLPHYMNKGRIMAFMEKRLGLSPESIIVAGDGHNDLPMFLPELASFMVCPGNACAELKQAALSAGGYVSEHSFSEGVTEGVRTVLGRNGV